MYKIPIDFWIVEYTDGNPPSDRATLCEDSFLVTKKLMQKLGIRIVYSVASLLPVSVSPKVPSDNPFAAPGVVRDAVIKTGMLDMSVHNHLFIPAIKVGDRKFFGGAAGCVGCPSLERVSVSVGDTPSTLINPKYRSVVRGVACCAAHEIAHVYGARHNDKSVQGMMSSHLNLFNDYTLVDWPKSAKREVAVFLKENVK